MPFIDDINKILRDHQGYAGDGHGGAGALPTGDRATARKPIDKRDLRELMIKIAQTMGDIGALDYLVQQGIDAAGSAVEAAGSANAAIAAAASLGAKIYKSSAAGVAATAAGEYFYTVNLGGGLDVWSNTAGAAVFQATIGDAPLAKMYSDQASTSAVSASDSAIEAALYDPTLRFTSVQGMLTSARPAAGAGTTWQAGDFLFSEAPGATPIVNGYPLATAAGVKLFVVGATASIKAFGAVGNGVANDTSAVTSALHALASGKIGALDFEDAVCGVAMRIAVTLTADAKILASAVGGIKAVNPITLPDLVSITTGGFDLVIDGMLWDGDGKCPGLYRVQNLTNSEGHLKISNNQHLNVRRTLAKDGVGACDAVQVRGGFRSVEVSGNRTKNITRGAGAGAALMFGTSGMAITPHDLGGGANLHTLSLTHTNNSYDTITTDDVGVARKDCDAIKFFTGEGGIPTAKFETSRFYSSGNFYLDCAGRGVKAQVSHGIVTGETITRQNVLPIFGSGTEINLQAGSGSVSDIEIFYNTIGGLSPFQHDGAATPGGVAVSCYSSPNPNRENGGPAISSVRIYNNVPEAVGVLGAVADFANDLSGSDTANFPLFASLSDCRVFGGAVQYLCIGPQKLAAKAVISLSNNYVNTLQRALMGVNSAIEPLLNLHATGNVNMSGAEVLATEITYTPGTRCKCVVNGYNNMGVKQANSGLTSDGLGQFVPFRADAIYPNMNGIDAGGGLNLENATIEQDATHVFRPMGYSNGGMFMLSFGPGKDRQVLFGIDATGANIMINGSSALLEFGAGANPDVANKFNVWHDGTRLHIQNRTSGSAKRFALACLG